MSSCPRWIQKIKDRADTATEGPWRVVERQGSRTDLGYYHHGDCVVKAKLEGGIAKAVLAPGDGPLAQQNKRDLEFMAHAREDIPKLVDLVTRMAEVLPYLARAVKGEFCSIDCSQCEYARDSKDGDCIVYTALQIMNEYHGEEKKPD